MNFGVPELTALISVVIIDLVLAGDNAIVVGLAAAGLPTPLRRRAIFWGIGAATFLRIGLAGLAVRLLKVIGLTLAGGILLLWVVWKLYREFRADSVAQGGPGKAEAAQKTFSQAVLQIVIADISMSLDNMLAVAGAARDHFPVLVAGLVLSVALMGVASHYLARLLVRHKWISWVGLVIITAVALHMIYSGSLEVMMHPLVPTHAAGIRAEFSSIDPVTIVQRCERIEARCAE